MDFVLYICYFKSVGELRGKSCGYHLTLTSFAVVFKKKTVAFKGFNFDFFFFINCLISTEPLRGHGQKKNQIFWCAPEINPSQYFSWARETLSGRVR